jgi:hypothetical protein
MRDLALLNKLGCLTSDGGIPERLVDVMVHGAAVGCPEVCGVSSRGSSALSEGISARPWVLPWPARGPQEATDTHTAY